jgi:hypothetical protein
MTTLRPNWNIQGPLDLVLPIDPDPWPDVDWEAELFFGRAHPRQDSQDRLNANRTWGTGNPAEPGGSGIAFGHSQPDIGSVRVACRALQNTVPGADVEHAIRSLLDPIAGFEMTHEVYFARQVQKATLKGLEVYPLEGPIVLDEPSWFPRNLTNLSAYAHAHPHQGLRKVNARALGWLAYGKAMEHKCARTLGAPVSTAWMTALLDVLELAAITGTGQIVCDSDNSQHPLDQVDVEYTFQWSILAMGAMACARRLHRQTPWWIEPHLDQLAALPPIAYYGAPSVPAFTYSEGGVIKVATGSGQQGDPNFGWLGTVNAVMFRDTGDPKFKNRVRQYGPTENTDEAARKFTMVQRGMGL